MAGYYLTSVTNCDSTQIHTVLQITHLTIMTEELVLIQKAYHVQAEQHVRSKSEYSRQISHRANAKTQRPSGLSTFARVLWILSN